MNRHSKLSEPELISLLKTGDELAFTEIYNRYWKKLFTVAANKIGDLEEAREIVQNIFISLWNRRTQLEIRGALSSYLAVSVKYRVINVLDKKNNHQIYLDNLRISDIDDSTRQWLAFMELKDRLAELVAELPEKCRLVFVLSRDGGHSQKQIAEKLGISEKTVEGHLTKAIKSLKTGLNTFLLTLL
jgi:RNA polymerase sigma-70 factor (ECF subfamily)